jgi:hypothetical protein
MYTMSLWSTAHRHTQQPLSNAAVVSAFHRYLQMQHTELHTRVKSRGFVHFTALCLYSATTAAVQHNVYVLTSKRVYALVVLSSLQMTAVLSCPQVASSLPLLLKHSHSAISPCAATHHLSGANVTTLCRLSETHASLACCSCSLSLSHISVHSRSAWRAPRATKAQSESPSCSACSQCIVQYRETGSNPVNTNAR